MPNIPIPFVEPFPIKNLPLELILKPNGYMLVEGEDGKAYRISTESFYQMLHKVATPIPPSYTGPFIANTWFKPQVNSEDPGTPYPNLTPAKDENGNPTVLKAVEGYDTFFYFNGIYWIGIPNKLPGVVAKTIFDPTNNEEPSVMKATADRYDKTLDVLDFFLDPYEISPETNIVMPRPAENKNAFLNTQWQQFATPGTPMNNGVVNFSELGGDLIEITIEGNQLDGAGIGIIWLGLQNSVTGAKVALVHGSVAKGKYKFAIDAQQGFDKIYYSRLENDTVFTFKRIVKLPITTNSVEDYIKKTGVSQNEWDKEDAVNPATMKSTSKRYDKALDVLNSFVYPKGETDWADLTADKIEYQGIIYNTGGATEAQSQGACGLIYAKDLEGVSSLRVVGENMDLYGTTIAWWLGYRPDNTFDVLRSGIVASGSANIKTDPQYTYYRYSRPTPSGKLQMKKEVTLPVETDSVIDMIKSSTGGYSGILDLGSLGVKTTNTAAQNTSIINNAINEESSKSLQRLIMFPPGIFKVNEILLAPKTFLGGVDKEHTGLYTEAGSGTRSIIRQVNGQVQGGEIFNLSINGSNTTDGAVYINNTFGHKITNCGIQGATNGYGIKYVAGLYHAISDVYFSGGDIQLHSVTTQPMANNLVKYDRLYFVKANKLNVRIEGGSNFVFTTCNFEDSGISGDETTGGVHASNVSAGGEGVDVSFNNCWSEGIRGGFIYKIDNCKGNSVIRDSMLGKGGNGSGTIANAIINLNSNLLLSGATRFSGGSNFHPFPTNIRATGGSTLVDNPNINIGTNNVGTIKVAQYL